MTSQPQMQPPADADQRRAAKPVVVYALDQLPPYDAAFYDDARAERHACDRRRSALERVALFAAAGDH